MSKNGTSIKIIPYYIEKEKLYFLLGNSDKWLEWSTIGGTCEGEDEFKCLNREVEEETQLLLNINGVDLSKLKFIKYDLNITHRWFKKMVQKIYFLPISDPNVLTRKLEKFNTKEHIQYIKNKNNNIYKKYKVYLEFQSIKWIEITSKYWYLCMYNTIDYFQTNKNNYIKMDPIFTKDLETAFNTFVNVYKNKGEKYTGKDGDRIDPIFLKGLLTLSSGSTIEDVVNDLKTFLNINRLNPNAKEFIPNF